ASRGRRTRSGGRSSAAACSGVSTIAVTRRGRVACRLVARQLWLLRHAEAVPHDSRASDADRELTPVGRAQATAAGAALSKLGLELAACFTSPKVRARDTAHLAC